MATRKKPIKRRRKTKPSAKLKQKILLLKNKAKSLLNRLKSKGKSLLGNCFSFFKFLALFITLSAGVLSFTYMSVKAPEWHEDFLTAKMGRNVVVLTGFDNFNSGGTGFQMETKYGLKVISNAHVCEVGVEKGYMLAHTSGFQQILKIEKIDPMADLCMLSKVNGLPGLKLASEPDMGDTIGILGHPLLQPQTFSKGRILAKQVINVATGFYDENTCKGPGARRVPTWFADLCVKMFTSYYTNAVIFPGNSGSPAVNFYGNVVGVVFAGNNRTNYGHLVTYEDLKRFTYE